MPVLLIAPYAPDGSIRRWFMGGRCRYRSLERTHTQNVLEAMAYNLKRMPRLLMLQGIK